MKKKAALIPVMAVFMCCSCGQQVVAHKLPDDGNSQPSVVEDDIVLGASDNDSAMDYIVIGASVDDEAEDMADISEEAEVTMVAVTTAVSPSVTTEISVMTTASETAVETTETEDIFDNSFYFEEDEEEYEEEYEEPEYDYDPAEVAAKVKTLNKTADSIRDEISAFLVKAVFGGYGMTLGGEGTFMAISIEDGVWTVMVDDTEAFRYKEDMEWFGYGEADSTTDKADAEEPDTLLAIALVKKFPHIKNGSAGVWLEGGSCKAAYFTEDTTAGDGQMDYLLGEGGWLEKYCEWDGYNQGMSEEGNIVGTSPMLKFAVEE